jgi:alpha-beta hydrolase superfamily lysophospholipase
MGREPVRRTRSQYAARDGLRLFRRAWLPAEARRAVVLVHGFAEHSGRYDHLGTWLAERACAVHAYDHRGHGRSEGPRCHVDRFDEFLDDLEDLLHLVRGQHPGLPVALVGHSMGGLIVAALLSQRQPSIQAAATSGAALALSQDVSRLRIRLARLLRSVLPRLQIDSGIDPEGLSRDPEVVRRYVEDPLVGSRMTTSLAAELLAAVERTARGAQHVHVPLLLLHGEDDPLCPVAGSRAFHEALPGAAADLRTYPRLRHEIFNEPEQEQVFQDLLDWLRSRQPSGVG